MKKTYRVPAIQVTKIISKVIIATSILRTSGADGFGVGGSTTDEGITEGNSRSDNSWDIWGNNED